MRLEKLYLLYNRREFIHPDPLEFIYKYDSTPDREIVGLIASSLAYGRVNQILKSVSHVLNEMGSSPFKFVTKNSDSNIKKKFAPFQHRFTTGKDLSALLIGIKKTIEKYGSLKDCFLSGLDENHPTTIPALSFFIKELGNGSVIKLLPPPEKGSACKRLNLFLRWMVRSDEVDPGCWSSIPASKLIVPLDTHMHKISLKLELTKRKQANLQTALDITKAFAKISPADPVKYDFTLTRFGIRNDFCERTLYVFQKNC